MVRALFSGGLRGNVFWLFGPQDEAPAWHLRRLGRRQTGDGEEIDPPETFASRRGCLQSHRLQLDLEERRDRAPCVWGDRLPARLLVAPRSRCSMTRDTCVTRAEVVDSPGVYALGLPVLRRRKSTFIHGIRTTRAR